MYKIRRLLGQCRLIQKGREKSNGQSIAQSSFADFAWFRLARSHRLTKLRFVAIGCGNIWSNFGEWQLGVELDRYYQR